MLSIPKRVSVLSLACVLSLLAAPILAQEFKVKLIATLDNGPAMEKVEWTVYRNGTEAVTKADKHLAEVKIPGGKYTAEARLTGSNNRTVVRKRSFYVMTDTKVVVPLD